MQNIPVRTVFDVITDFLAADQMVSLLKTKTKLKIGKKKA